MNLKVTTAVLAAACVAVGFAQTVDRPYGASGNCGDAAFAIFANPAQHNDTAVNISWGSLVSRPSFVEYGPADGGFVHRINSRGALCTTFDSIYSKLRDNSDVVERHVFDKHGVQIGGLTPDTRYRYRIGTDTGDSIWYSDTRFFKTGGADTFKVAVIGDFHHYSPLWRRLDAAMGMLGVLDSVSGGFDWVLSTGDQCAWGASYNYWAQLADQPAYQNYMWASVEGNHDYDARDKAQRGDAYFRDSHFNAPNGYEGQVGNVYWFRRGPVLFVMLNNEAMRNAQTLDVARQWFKEVVSQNQNAKYIVAVQHYEWLIGTDGSDSQLQRFAGLFDDLGVDLAIAGNNHAYIRTPALKGMQPARGGDGTYYVVLPSSDNSRGRALKPLAANADKIDMRWSQGPQTVGAMIMDVNPDRIVMMLYDRHGNVCDAFTVPAKR